jgi:UDP-N-acetylmuramate dehydrogenase
MTKLNLDLSSYNTFGIQAQCAQFEEFNSVEELAQLIQKHPQTPTLILGGGSNILFTKNFDGLVLKNEIKGIQTIEEDEKSITLAVGAGENWHEFVLHTIHQGYAGLENLSLIPGNVGACPMQNIGAYGVESKDLIVQVNAFHIESGKIHTFSNEACEFGYRESVFKRKLKGQYVIIEVCFKLLKEAKVNTTYGAINTELASKNIFNPTIKDVSDAVIAIRSSKLPNPKEIGNAGSFFKNPVISKSHFDSLQKSYPNIPNYPAPNNQIKLAAGWLIEQAGWKGYTNKNYGVHKLQALVLVNYGGATGQEIYDLSSQIIADIQDKFGIELEREVNII